MKRYEIDVETFGTLHATTSYCEEISGEWVKYEDVKELIDTVKEYLTFDSCDGKIKYRKPLREKLKELTE